MATYSSNLCLLFRNQLTFNLSMASFALFSTCTSLCHSGSISLQGPHFDSFRDTSFADFTHKVAFHETVDSEACVAELTAPWKAILFMIVGSGMDYMGCHKSFFLPVSIQFKVLAYKLVG